MVRLHPLRSAYLPILWCCLPTRSFPQILSGSSFSPPFLLIILSLPSLSFIHAESGIYSLWTFYSLPFRYRLMAWCFSKCSFPIHSVSPLYSNVILDNILSNIDRTTAATIRALTHCIMTDVGMHLFIPIVSANLPNTSLNGFPMAP